MEFFFLLLLSSMGPIVAFFSLVGVKHGQSSVVVYRMFCHFVGDYQSIDQ